ncbi:MAG: isocitrate dehydrogenase kinase/phosphatase-domain containing protein, partial [Candidatus Promineifilaceae bacterium]
DIFPAEFERFLGLSGEPRRVFEEHHADLFDVAFWRDAQQRTARSEITHIFPYAPELRLRVR